MWDTGAFPTFCPVIVEPPNLASRLIMGRAQRIPATGDSVGVHTRPAKVAQT